MASCSALLWRRILVVSAIGGFALPAMAQQSVIPSVVTGLDANGGQKTQAVGSGTDGYSVPMPVTAASGTSIIGKVGIDQTIPGTTNGVVVNNAVVPTGSLIVSLTNAPAVTASAYTSGYCYGGLQTIAGWTRAASADNGSILQAVVVTDVSGQDAPVDVVIFNANPTNSTFTDHAACTVNTADVAKVVRVVHVTDCSLLGASAPGECQGTNLAAPVVLTSGTTAYAVAIVRGTPTPTGTTNIQFRYKVLQD